MYLDIYNLGTCDWEVIESCKKLSAYYVRITYG